MFRFKIEIHLTFDNKSSYKYVHFFCIPESLVSGESSELAAGYGVGGLWDDVFDVLAECFVPGSDGPAVSIHLVGCGLNLKFCPSYSLSFYHGILL